MKVEKPRVALTLDDKVELTFTCDNAILDTLQAITSDFVELSIKEYKEHRSLSQNAFYWELLGKLSTRLHIPTIQLYKQYIRDYGKFEIVVMKDEAIETFTKQWSKNGIGDFAELVRKSNFEGYSILKVYFGSSTYNRAEMVALTEPVILDCEELGIATLSLESFKKLKNDVDSKKEIS